MSSPCSSDRLSPEPVADSNLCNGRASKHFSELPAPFKTPLRFGVDSLIASHDSRLDSTKDNAKCETYSSQHSPHYSTKDRDSDSSYHRSPRSDTSSPGSEPSPPPAHNKSHCSSFNMDDILGKSPSAPSRLPDATSPAYVPSPAHETRWPSSLAVSAGFPWLPSSRISPPPSKYLTEMLMKEIKCLMCHRYSLFVKAFCLFSICLKSIICIHSSFNLMHIVM